MKRLHVNVRGKSVMAYEEQGPGTTAVLFLHGIGGSGKMWHMQMRHLKPYGRMVALDLPGFTTGEPEDALEDLSAYAPFACDLLDELGIREAVWVGNSLGGRIALEAALLRPEKVLGLGLICSAGVHAAGVQAVRPNSVSKEEFDRLAFYHPQRITAMQSEASRRAAIATAELYGTLARRTPVMDLSERLGEVRVPTAVIWGRHDGVIPLPIGEKIAEEIAGTQLFVLEEAAHVPQIERPLEVNAALDVLMQDAAAAKA